MAAPQIPNLLSKRIGTSNPNRSPRLRGRDRDTDPAAAAAATAEAPANKHTHSKHDLAIQATDTDAATSRLSAVDAGYLSDPFASYFVSGPRLRRLPIINRGTYTRTVGLDRLIDAFLAEAAEGEEETDSAATTPTPENESGSSSANQTGITRQIISLGAGTDTRYFRLRQRNRHRKLLYHEIDFPNVCHAKRKIVEAHAALRGEQVVSAVPVHVSVAAQAGAAPAGAAPTDDIAPTPWSLADSHCPSQPQYICHAVDLRTLAADISHTPLPLLLPHLDTRVATLVLSECCLCYLAPPTAHTILAALSAQIPALAMLIYEPIGPHDAFGQVMTANLRARGLVMPTVSEFPTLESQMRRLRGVLAGGDSAATTATRCEARSIDAVWNEHVSVQEKMRVDRLEGLDELEEWELLASHYMIAWAARGDNVHLSLS